MSLSQEEVRRLREKLGGFSVTINGVPQCGQHHVMELSAALNTIETLKSLVLHILNEMDKEGA